MEQNVDSTSFSVVPGETMSERTFIIIKPDHVKLADTILAELDSLAAREHTARVEVVPRDIIEAHYTVHRERPFYQYLVDSFVGKSVVLGVYAGLDVVRKVMDACGPTDPAKAPSNTIRGKYSTDSLERAIAEGRPVRNVIHRSDSVVEAEREIDVWKSYLR